MPPEPSPLHLPLSHQRKFLPERMDEGDADRDLVRWALCRVVRCDERVSTLKDVVFFCPAQKTRMQVLGA